MTYDICAYTMTYGICTMTYGVYTMTYAHVPHPAVRLFFLSQSSFHLTQSAFPLSKSFKHGNKSLMKISQVIFAWLDDKILALLPDRVRAVEPLLVIEATLELVTNKQKL